MAIVRTDKVFAYLKTGGTYVWFRYSVDASLNRQFLFQTGTSAPDMATVNALAYFQPPAGATWPIVNSTGDVIDPAIVPGGGLTPVAVPASSASAGTTNQVSLDNDYFYVCTATNTWRRTPIADWA